MLHREDPILKGGRDRGRKGGEETEGRRKEKGKCHDNNTHLNIL